MATKKVAAEEVNIQSDEVLIPGSDNETPPTDKTETDKTEIPELVDKLLNLYPKYEKLYVDDKCGAFVEGSKLPVNNKAVLYTNPYYKK